MGDLSETFEKEHRQNAQLRALRSENERMRSTPAGRRYQASTRDHIVAHIGPYIKRRRKELRLSLQEVADRADTSKSHIWELEQGRSANPTIGMAIMLCGALQCSLDNLLGVDFSRPFLSDDELALIAAHRQIFGND